MLPPLMVILLTVKWSPSPEPDPVVDIALTMPPKMLICRTVDVPEDVCPARIPAPSVLIDVMVPFIISRFVM
jgi:hypothetical protein